MNLRAALVVILSCFVPIVASAANKWTVNATCSGQGSCSCDTRLLASLAEVLACGTLAAGDRVEYRCVAPPCVEPPADITKPPDVELQVTPRRSVVFRQTIRSTAPIVKVRASG